MAPKQSSKSSYKARFEKYCSFSFIREIVVNPARLSFAAVLLLISELAINIFVVGKVPYTEIDWKAYMQECEGFLNGTLDYSELRGDTGPLVYPAGFVYVYSVLYFVTNRGVNVRLAQYVFIGIYMLQLMCVLRIYLKTRKVPPYVLVVSILTSYRIHSIYILRLFNDPVAVLLFYVALNFYIDSKWTYASVFYSLAVSVKMNILLYAPAVFLFYIINLGLKGTVAQLFICGIIQVALGLPFLIHSPLSYLKGSFDIGRVFNHTWTVNYRFLDVDVFENKSFHLILLAVHIVLLAIFFPMFIKYFNSYNKLRHIQTQAQTQIDRRNVETQSKKAKSKIPTAVKHRKAEAKKEDENMSPEQENFLKSFESMLQKSGAPKKSTKVESVEERDPFYSINFDIITQLCILPMFVCNFIGVVCARSLHYQFYSWYFHSLPYLLWSNNFTVKSRFLLLALIELCWNTYPSTNYSSFLLHFCHLLVLWGVYSKLRLEIKTAQQTN